ncbi:hypothetical protein M422DRAFT_257712 [Sphaerobolus stellatus SS14]|uniref:Uncharacterized protein n=1 Tax=Sphaerobolus stellatus (strain SS14) TaxID=990650 RepID=A0A0C9VN46_SPHS4|nr:hypothetical protein M422DRAFT_257712 [Sphaerobolus stellatus SS14]
MAGFRLPPIDGDAPSSQDSTLRKHGTLPYTSMSSEPVVHPNYASAEEASETVGIRCGMYNHLRSNNKRRHHPHPHPIPLPHPPGLRIQQHNLLRPLPLLRTSAPPILHNELPLLLLHPPHNPHADDSDFHPKSSKLLKDVEDHQETFTNLKRDFRGGAFGVVGRVAGVYCCHMRDRDPIEGGEGSHAQQPSTGSNTPSNTNAPPPLPPSPSAPPFSAHEFMRLTTFSTSNHAVVRFYRSSEMAERLNVNSCQADVFYEAEDNLHLHNPRIHARTDPPRPSHGTDIRARAGGKRKKDGAEAALGPICRVAQGRKLGWGVDLGREHEMDDGEDAGKKGLRRRLSTLLPHHWHHHHLAHVLPKSQASCPEHRADLRALDPHVPRPPIKGSADKGAGHEVRGEDGAGDCDACGTGVLGGHAGGVFGV